jgi:hypothetical protein
MRTKILFRMAASAVTALLAMACIYPYPVEIERGGEYPLVVEGDILIGWTTTVKLSHVRPFNLTDYKSIPVVARGYVEGEDGSRVEGTSDFAASTSEKGILYFDTSDLRKDQRYRLHVETFPQEEGESHVFESAWLMPCPAPTIDALSYSRNADFRELWIGLSMHCNGAHHFRWSFNETWEYHSDIHSYLDYIPSKAYWDEYTGNWETEGGHYQEIFPGNYYCWKSYDSPSINIFSTVNQTEDRFEELAFHTIPLSDKRIQSLYRITVQLAAQSEDAYNYWYNIRQNTSGQGSIFSPVPSEMASNVFCISDPSVQVVGYLNAAVPTRAILYYDNLKEGFYEPERPHERMDTTIAASNIPVADNLYKSGFLPYRPEYNSLFSAEPSDYTWALSVCIDCRKQGGTRTRPADWPQNGHI